MLQHKRCSQTDIQSPYLFQTDTSIDRHTGCNENAPQAGMHGQQNNTQFIKYIFLTHVRLGVPRNANLILNCFIICFVHVSTFLHINLLTRHISIPAI